jgi:integrase
VSQFVSWCEQTHENANVNIPSAVDEVLAEYLQWLYDSGAAQSLARNTVWGLVHRIPSLRRQLPTSTRTLKGWSRLEPTESYPPLTWPLTVAIAVQMARHHALREAIGTLFAFHAMLRVGELVALRREDIATAGDRRLGGSSVRTVARLRHTKTGPNKDLEIYDLDIASLLSDLVSATPRGARLFPFTADRFRRLFHTVCAELGLSSAYVPHSLRHGGATYLHAVRGVEITEVMIRGRWANTKAARMYIQSGRALLLQKDVPREVHAFGVAMSANIIRALSLAQRH